jgi:hypothetical protein
MASYIELRNLFSDSDLGNKIDVAVMIAANELITSASPTVEGQAWAAHVFSNPRVEGQKALMAVLSLNKDATVAQITGAADVALQTNVDLVVPSLVSAYSV